MRRGASVSAAGRPTPAVSMSGVSRTATASSPIWTPEPHHQAFEGAVAGGIIGALFDCHCNWTAAYHLMKASGADVPPPTVTADYAVRFKRPTNANGPLTFRSRVVEASADRATVEGTVESDGVICATCRGTFVAVKPGHPAYHRWE